jgi:hypothetical protein
VPNPIQDQRSGRLTAGVVTDVLTNNPSRGILDASVHWHRHCTGHDMVEESLHDFPFGNSGDGSHIEGGHGKCSEMLDNDSQWQWYS